MMDYDMIGAIKIKDGLFIGDEFAAQVIYTAYSYKKLLIKYSLGLGVRRCKQGHSHYKLCWKANTESLGTHRSCLSYFLLVRLG